MFERFTDNARRVVMRAQDEARELDHPRIGTEHLLLGMLRVEAGMAFQVLDDLGIEHEAVRDKVVEYSGRGAKEMGEQIPFGPRAKKVLELSLRESLDMGDDAIGTQHVLLGLLREGEGLGAGVLADLGVDLQRVRERLVRRGVNPRPPAFEEIHRLRPSGRVDVVEALNALERRLEAIEIRLSAIEDRLDP